MKLRQKLARVATPSQDGYDGRADTRAYIRKSVTLKILSEVSGQAAIQLETV